MYNRLAPRFLKFRERQPLGIRSAESVDLAVEFHPFEECVGGDFVDPAERAEPED